MPSPLGHAMAGAMVAWSTERLPPRFRPALTSARCLTALCVGLAIVPDADLLFMRFHRTASHSLVAVAVVTIVVAAVTGWVTGRVRWGLALTCGVAYASHLLLDWLGEDRNVPHGIQALWPFSDAWFVSNWNLFLSTERRAPLSLPTIQHNFRAALQELVLLGPPLALLWFARIRRARTPDAASGGAHEPHA